VPCETFTQFLGGTGFTQYQPCATYYWGNSGLQEGYLRGPAGTDFDLYLWRWNGFSWVTVAQGISSGPDETVIYNGTAGYYVWRVESYSGSGSYTFKMQRP
jgi:hypothetical protein